MWQSVEILNVFNTLTLKQIFWKTKTSFKKLGYRFLVESTKIEKASFPYKTAISEANIKTNRMESTKWTYHEERSFASNYFKFCFSLRTSYKELIWCTIYPNGHIRIFCKPWSFTWGYFLPVRVLKKIGLGLLKVFSALKLAIINAERFNKANVNIKVRYHSLI